MMVSVTGGVITGIAIGIIVDRLILKMDSKRKLEKVDLLKECFGEPMCTNTFSLNEVRDWIKSRESHFSESSVKAIVLKANSETLSSIGKDLDIGNGLDNYVIIAIENMTTKEMIDSVLVKCENLDMQLENALAKGNGVLVIEGK